MKEGHFLGLEYTYLFIYLKESGIEIEIEI
jgi:hypothetical protein